MSKRLWIDFLGQPLPATQQEPAATTSVVAVATDNAVNQWTFGNGATLTCLNTEANTDIVPDKDAVGLIPPLDEAANDGIEIYGCNTAALTIDNSDGSFTIGTDPAFEISVKFDLVTVANFDVCAVGFRKQEASIAEILADEEINDGSGYTDCAFLNVNLGNIDTVTRLNSGTGVSTDSTDNWSDGDTKTLTVKVSAAGVVTFFIDGTAPTTTQAFTFDDTDVVVPCMFITKAVNGSAGDIKLINWYQGPQ
jgi:hypothetical protein|tara:strand:- start:816 stop:1568 length:753 start_codon:yes stop_codon:yes gene_type:complete